MGTDVTASGGQGRKDTEPVQVRNYDHTDGHSIHVRLTNVIGRLKLTERCYLAPGQSRRVLAPVETGEYRVVVRVDGVERMTAECRLGRTPDQTAVVELGKDVVSVSQGAIDLATD